MSTNTKIVITAEDRASQALRAISTSFDSVLGLAGKVTGAFAAITGISLGAPVAGLAAMVKSTAEAQDGLLKMSQKAGISVESLSGLGYAAKLAGADTETLVKASKALSQNIVDAGREANQSTTVFGGMGIAIKDAAGGLRATDQILLDVAGKFSGMEDGANKSALAVKLFGKSGLDLIPFLNQGKDGIQALTKEAERLGIVVSTDAAMASERFNDNLERMSMAAEGLKRSIGNAALPLVNEFAQQLTDASTAGGGLAADLKELTSRANIEAWAEKGATAMAWIVDAGRGVAAVFQAAGANIAASMAMIQAAVAGNFEGVGAIFEENKAKLSDIFSYEQTRDKTERFFDDYRRTVRINGEKIVYENAAQAEVVRKAWDEAQTGMKAASKGYVEFDEKQLAAQDAIRKKYSEEEKRRTLGEIGYKKTLIEEKYQAELNAIRGAQGAAALEVEIRRRMADEIDALERGKVQAAVDGNATVLASAAQGAASRVAIETQAAQQTMQVWSQANAAKAGATGGQIMNAGTPGEFVSSWDASGKYVGDLGSPVSSPGALGNAYSTSGRRLSVQEQIAMLNGYARFASGGSFMVGGTGGTDSQLVAFKASPDERVTIQTPEQQRASGGVTLNINVANGNPSAIIAAIKQLLRTDPGMFSGSLARAG